MLISKSLLIRTISLPFAWVLAAMPLISSAQAPAPAPPRPIAAPCHSCGVVESVVAVQRRGQPKGIGGSAVTPGMALGGVAGGLLGNQLGHGSGRAATTLLGAAGGAYAGHALEKNNARYTAYVMRIRMRDGTMRTVEQRRALPRGSHVIVEGRTARLA